MLLHCLNQRTLNLYIYLCICVHFFSKKTPKHLDEYEAVQWTSILKMNNLLWRSWWKQNYNRDASPTIRQRRSRMSSRRTGNQKVCWYLEINNYCNTDFVLWVEYSRAAVQFVSCAVTSRMDWTYHDIYCVA